MSSDPRFSPSLDEDARRRFETAWREGRPKPIEHYLPPEWDPRFLGTLEELILIELEFAWKSRRTTQGAVETTLPFSSPERPSVENYLPRFQHIQHPEILRRLLEEEYRVRWRWGDRPSSDDYRRRFPSLDLTFDEAAGPAPTADGELPTVAGYEVQGELGRGGMGVVYRARQIGLNRLVALKMILAGAYATAEERARFRIEAEAVAALQHPNIVQVYEIGEQGGRPYYSLEYLDGGNLAHKLAGAPQPPMQAAQVVESLARAVEWAHRRGIVHRDLKPANVLLTAEGLHKIADFGLAKRLDGSSIRTQTGAVVGTPSYMAPEQAAGKHGEAGPAVDVYALGAILYEMLTGRPPFRAETPTDTLLQVVGEEPVSPSRLQSKVPCDLETICLKCLQKEPHRRYAGAAVLADDLRRFQAGEPIQARPVGWPERLGRWCRRNPALAAASALATVGLIAATALLIAFLINRSVAAANLANANADLHRKQDDLTSALKDVQEQRELADDRGRRAERQSANLALDKGIALCERGNLSAGMLWLAYALNIAPPQAEDLQRACRLNLAAWRSKVHPLRAVFTHKWQPIFTVAFSPDGNNVLTGNAEGARLWNVATGEPVGPPFLDNPIGHVYLALLGPDGKTALVANSGDSSVGLWDAAAGKQVAVFPTFGSRVCAFSRDGRTVFAGGRLWDAVGKPLAATLPNLNGLTAAAFNPDGTVLITGSLQGGACLWDAASGQPRAELPQTGSIYAVAFSPDGKRVVTASSDGTACVWDVGTRKQVGAALTHAGAITTVAFSPDGRKVLTGSVDKTARMWIAGTGAPIGDAMTHNSKLLTAMFSPDASVVLTTAADSARLWDARTGRPFGAPLQHGFPTTTGAFSPDGRTVLTGCFDNACLWDVSGPQGLAIPSPTCLIEALEHPLPAFGPDGKIIPTVGASDGIELRDAAGRPVGQPLAHSGPIRCLVFSPDGRTLVTGSAADCGRLWEVSSGKPLGRPLQPQGPVWTAAFSPNGDAVLTGSADGTARLWNAVSGEAKGPPMAHPGAVTFVAFSPREGKTLLTVCEDNTARLWDASTGTRLGEPLRHKGVIHEAAFSPDGKTVATGSEDGSARIWDACTGKPTSPVLSYGFPIKDLNYSLNGDVLVSNLSCRGGPWGQIWNVPAGNPLPSPPGLVWARSTDLRTFLLGPGADSVRLWDAHSQKYFGPPLSHQGVIRVAAFSPDGKLVVTASDDETARVWDVTTGKSVGPPVPQRSNQILFSSDGARILMGQGSQALLLDAPAPLEGDPERILLWVQTLTATQLDDAEGGVSELDTSAWQSARRRLEEMGGPPMP